MGKNRRAAALLCLPLLAATVAAEERPWVEVKSPRFTIVSQASEKSARDLAWQFEQVHSVFTRAYPWAKLESGRPFVVVVVRNEGALRELLPQFWQGYQMKPAAAFVSGLGRDFVAIRNDLGGATPEGENPYSTAYQGYVSIVLSSSFSGQLPFWFHRGLQAFFGNTLVRDKDVHVGRLINRDLELLNQTARYSIPELMAVDSDSRTFRKAGDREVFDAQAWIFVHYLFFGENGTLQPKMNRFAGLLRGGTPGPEAWKAAFGDLDPLEKGLNAYITRRLYRYTQLNLDVNVDRAAFKARPVGPAEAAALRAMLVQAMQEPAASARALADAALKLDPNEPLAHEALGLIEDKENRRAEATAAFGQAMDHGSQSFYAHYRLAQLLWKPNNDAPTLTRMAAALERATQLNPDNPASQSFLADVRTSAGTAATALEPARTAVALAPGDAYHHRSLARALANVGQLDEATAEAGRSLALSKTDEQKQQSREMLAWIARKRLAAAAPERAPEATAEATTADGTRDESRTVATDTHPCDVDDPKICQSWLADAEKACADGSLEACNSAGWAYTGARTVKRDPVKAAGFLEKACAGDIPPACVNLAVVLANRRTPADTKRAIELTTKACAAGVKEACDLKAEIRARQR